MGAFYGEGDVAITLSMGSTWKFDVYLHVIITTLRSYRTLCPLGVQPSQERYWNQLESYKITVLVSIK